MTVRERWNKHDKEEIALIVEMVDILFDALVAKDQSPHRVSLVIEGLIKGVMEILVLRCEPQIDDPFQAIHNLVDAYSSVGQPKQ